MTAEATIVVDFGESVASTELVVVELDDQVNRDGAGNVLTGFAPGDQVGFIVHFDPAVLRVDRVESSCGSVRGGNRVRRDREKEFIFVNTDAVQLLPHIPLVDPRWNWRGAGTEVDHYARVNDPVIICNGRELQAAGRKLPAIGVASYKIDCRAWVFMPPDIVLAEGESWKAVVCVYMEAA